MKFLPPEWHDSLSSTNTYIENRIVNQEATPSGMIVAAREQTAGKGRYDRKWVSGKHKNLTFSFLYQTKKDQSQLPSLTMACSIAIANALQQYEIPAMTKWPNDVIVHDKKICGVLSKQIPKIEDDVCFVIIGIGVNINMTDLDAMNIDRPATSVLIETGKTNTIESMLNRIIKELEKSITIWEKDGFEGIRNRWSSLHKPAGTKISVKERGQIQTGRLVDFGEYGELLLKDSIGAIHTIVQGDVVYD